MIAIRDIDFSKAVSNPSSAIVLKSSDFGLPDSLSSVIPVSVAVLDTGCPAHSGLRLNENHFQNNHVDMTGHESIPWDMNGHATAIAGAIAGKTAKFSGICSSALMYYAKCIDSDGKTSIKKIASGLLWSAAKEVDIAVVAAGSVEKDRYLEEVVAKCLQRGMIIVAAGKSNSQKNSKHMYPGNCAGVISCYFGEKTCVNARPEGGIDVQIGHRSSWTLAPDERYIKLGGSSMASAIVAGFMASHIASGMMKERLFEKMKEISSCQ